MSVVDEIEYNDFSKFYNDIFTNGELKGKFRWYIFHGQRSCKFELLPTLFRSDNFSVRRVWNATGFPDYHSPKTYMELLLIEYAILRNFYYFLIIVGCMCRILINSLMRVYMICSRFSSMMLKKIDFQNRLRSSLF